MSGSRKVLIVDDEFRIGVLVKKLIHWEELDMECLNVLDNGEAALREIRESHPNIVITDVRMPKISGLDLIKLSRKITPTPYFIVVSGYREFEYARQALEYGVEDYILKPVNEKDLNNALQKIRLKLDEKDRQNFQQKKLEKMASEGSKIIKRNFLKNIIDQEDLSSMGDFSVYMRGELYRAIDIKLDYVDYNRNDSKQDRLTVDRVRTIVEAILGKHLEELLICEKDNLHIYCLFNYNTIRSADVKNLMSDILLRIKEYLMGFDQYEVTIGIGGEKTKFSEIRFSILESYRAVCARMKYGTGRLIYMDGVLNEDSGRMEERFEGIREDVRVSIDISSSDMLVSCITKLFEETGTDETGDMVDYYTTAEKLIELFFDCVNQKEFTEQKKELLGKCQHCYKPVQMTRLLKEELGGFLEMLQAIAETKFMKPIQQAKQYVEEHYQEKILLEDIAAVVDLNPVYFSSLFKKETNMNFSAYLIEFRMEKAKKMLVTTNETVAAIGAAVGYGDQKYFSQLFKKSVGVKPSIYRRLHM
ncbi:MAG: response regulator [Clostridiales bacterium]|nr:response regulator [Clostridiales bacterium]